MRSNYGGGLAYRELAGTGNDGVFAKMYLEQSAALKKARQEWTQERKDALAKYRAEMGALRAKTDGINEFLVLKNGLSPAQRDKIEGEFNARAAVSNTMMKDLVADYVTKMKKAGVTTALGYNFYDLRGPAFLLYPVNTPLRNSFPRWGKQNDGYGTAVHWKYTSLNPGVSYGGASEGNRVALATPNENDAIATYKELGIERSVTFTADFASEGYTDITADEHLRGLHEIYLQEESLILGGNAGTGTGNNGFQLGTANAPSCSVKAGPAGTPNDGGAGFANNTTVSCRVIELTMLGNPANSQFGYQAPPTVVGGLTPSFTRTNADASTDTIAGGMGAVSAASNVATALTATPYVLCQVTPKAGAVAWAWFIDVTDASSPAATNAVLAAITTVPFFYAGQSGTASGGTQTAAATGLNADQSNETLDFDGLIAWAVKGGAFLNQGNLNATNPATGNAYNGNITQGMAGLSGVPGVMEIDYDLEQQFLGFQATADCMYMSPNARRVVSACIMKGVGSLPSPYRFQIERDEQGQIVGAFAITAYFSQYTMKETGSETLPIRTHTMLPGGTIVYDKSQNPYPHSRLPGVRGLFVQRDYYSVEWALTSRKRPFGTYCHETLGHYLPGLTTIRTGIQGSN